MKSKSQIVASSTVLAVSESPFSVVCIPDTEIVLGLSNRHTSIL